MGLPCSANFTRWVSVCLFAGGIAVRVGQHQTAPTIPLTFLVQACQHLWPVNNNDIYQQFTYVTHTIISSSHPVLMLPELNSPRGFFSQSLTEGFIVTRASHKAVTSYACRDRKLPTKRQADSAVSNKRGDFQVAPGALFCY